MTFDPVASVKQMNAVIVAIVTPQLGLFTRPVFNQVMQALDDNPAQEQEAFRQWIAQQPWKPVMPDGSIAQY